MLTLDEIRDLQFVFIIGKGRSGTSLLQTILDTHPNVLSTMESPFIILLKKKYFHLKKWESHNIDAFISDLYEEKKFKHLWNIDSKELRRFIDQYPLNELNFGILCKLIYLNFPSPFKKEKISLLIDKNPSYSIFIKELWEVFPDAKFIHLIRDYRDNIISSRKAFGHKNIALTAQTWVIYNTIIDTLKEKHPNKFFTIRYEDLVTSPENFIPEICHFLDVSFRKEMFDFHLKTSDLFHEKKSENKILTDVINTIHLNLLNPINTTQINNWKNELTQSEIQIAEYIAGNTGKKYDYYQTTNIRKFNYFYISSKTYLQLKLNNWITINYYKSPSFIRNILKSFSTSLFKWFNFTTRYNKAELQLKKKLKK